MSTRDESTAQFQDSLQYNLPGSWLSHKLDMCIECLRIHRILIVTSCLGASGFGAEGAKSDVLVFTGRTIVVTKPIFRDCTKLIQVGHWKRQPGEWGYFDLIVSSIAHEGAFTKSFGTFATVLASATSSLKSGCLPST